MNKIYKVIFNRNKNRYEIVSELASSRGGKCKVKAGKQIAKLFMTGLLATFLSSVALAADEDVKVKYDAATGTIKIVKTDPSTNAETIVATYAVGGKINPIGQLYNKDMKQQAPPTGIIAMGDQSKAVQSNSIAIGANAHAGDLTPAKDDKDHPEDNSNGYIAIGTETVASGNRSIALGNKSSTNNGSYNIAQGNDAISIGTSTSVFGNSGVSIGRRNIIGVPDPDLVNNGVLTTKSKTKYGENDLGGNSVIVGAYNVAYGNRSNIIGTYSRAMGSNSVAIGSGVQSLSDGSIAIGKGSGYEFEDGSRKKGREKEFYGRDWELPPEYKVLKQVLSTDIAENDQYKGTGKGITWENGGTLPKYNNYGAGSSDPGGFIVEGKNALGVGSYTQVRGDSAIGLATGEMTADLSLKDKSEYAKAMRNIMDLEEKVYTGNELVREAKEKLEEARSNNSATAELEKSLTNAENKLTEYEKELATAKKEFRTNYLSEYSFVEGEAALGVGRKILAQGDRSMAVGDQAKAISNDAIAYGGKTLANGTNSMAMGGNAHVGTTDTSFDNSMAIGSHTNVQAGNAVALGAFSQVTGTNSLALGFGTQSSTDSNSITYNSVSGHDSTLIGSYGNIAGNNSILIGSSGSIANDRVVGLGNNINIAAADSDDQENNTAGSVFLGDHAGYVKDSKRARSLGEVTLVGSEEKKELTESLSSTKGALRDYTKDFIYIYMLENQDDGTQIGAPIAVRSDFAGGDSTVGVVSVGSTYEQTFENLDKIKEHHKKVGSLITVPVEVTVQVMKNGISLGKQQQTRYFAADATQEQINSDSTLSDEDKKKVWDTIQESRKKADTKYTVFETRRIQNVAPGLIGVNSTDAINGSQLFATNQMLGNLVGSLKKTFGDNVTITPDGQIGPKDKDTPFTLGWIAKADSVDGSNGTVAYEVDKAEDETEEANKEKVNKLKSTGYVVDAAKTMTFKAGKNIGLVQKPGELSISTIDKPSFTSVELRGETKDVDGSQVTPVTMLDSSGMQVYTETVTPDGSGSTTTKNVSTTVNNEGVTTDGTVKVTNGKDGNQAKDLVTIGKNVDPNAPAGTDGENGTIGLDGKNGSSATITVDRVTSSLDDTKNIGGTDPKQDISENNPAKMDRITYTTKNKDGDDVTHEVATLDDGLFFSGDSADGKNGNMKNTFGRKLSEEAKIVGGVTTPANLTDNNIGVVSNGSDTLTIKLAKQLTGLDSATYTSPTTKTDDGDATSTMKVDGNGIRFVGDNNAVKTDAPSLTTDGITGGNKQITNVGSGLKDGDTTISISDLDDSEKWPNTSPIWNNAVNVGDLKNIIDTGFKLNTSGQATKPGASTVKIGDTINIIDGANTKVSAIDDSTTGTHTFHIDVNGLPMSYTDNEGNALTKIGDKFYKTEDLENGTPKPNKQPLTDNEVSNNISLLDKTGNTTAAPQIKNVGSGLINNNSAISPSDLLNITDTTNPVLKNAVNVGDLKNVAAAVKTEVTGTGKAIVTNTTAQDGHTIYNVHVDPVVNVVAADGKTQVVRGDDGKYYDPADIENKTFVPDGKGGGNWYNTSDIGDNGQPNTGASVQNINPVDVKNNFVNPNGTGSIVVDNVKSGIGGEVKDPAHNNKNTFIDNVNKVGKTTPDGTATPDAISENTVVNAKDLKNLVDTGFKLNTSGQPADSGATTVKIGETIKVVDGTNTKVSAITTSKDGVHAFHIDVTGMPISYTDTDGNALTKIGDNYYKNTDITNGVPNKDAVAVDPEKVTDNIKVINKDGSTTNPGTISNVKSAIDGVVGNGGPNGSTINGEGGTNTFIDNVNRIGADTNGIDKNSVVTTGDLKNLADTPLFFSGDAADGKEYNGAKNTKNTFGRKLSEEAKIVGGVTAPANLTDNNIGVVSNGSDTLTIKLAKQLTGLDSATYTSPTTKTDDGDATSTMKVDGNGIRFVGDNNAVKNDAPSLTTDGIDGGNKQITNIGSGLKNGDTTISISDLDDPEKVPNTSSIWNNAVNVGDLKKAKDAATTEVTGTGKAIVTKTVGNKGQNIYNVHVDPVVDVVATDGKTQVVRGDDGKYYNPSDIENKTYIPNEDGNGGSWYNKSDIGANGKPNTGAPVQNISPVDVKNNFVNPNGTGSIVLDNVKSGIGGEVKNADGNNTFIDNINKVGKKSDDGTAAPDAISENTVVNAKDLKNVVDTGFKLNTSGQGKNPADTVKIGDTIQVVDGKNTTVSAITNPTTGVHEFHIDVTGLPVTYTATEGKNGQPVDVSKVGDTYQLADGTKLVKYGDKFYKPNQIVNGQPVGDAQGFTINDDIRLVNPNNGTGPVKITNVAPGVGDNDAVNMSQLKNLSAGSKTEVTGTGAAEVTKKTAKDGHDIYNVHVDKLLTVKPVTTGTAMERGADGKYYAPSEIQDKTFVSDGNGGGSWYAKDDVDEYGTPLDGKSPLAQQPTALDPNTLKTSVTNPNGNGPTIVDNVKSVLDGSGIGNGADMSSKIDTIENGKPVETAGSNQFIKDLTGLNPTTDADKLNSVSTVSDLQKVALTPLFFEGDTVEKATTNNTFGRKLSEKAKIVGGQKDVTKLTDNNIGVVSNGSDTLTIKLAKELQDLTSLTTIDETDGTKTIVSGKGVTSDGKVVVNNGKNGDKAKELVTIDKGTDGSGTDKEYGKIGLDGKNGSNATITIDRGTKSLNDDVNIGVDPSQPVSETNESTAMDRITYTTTGPNNTVINHEVATLDDGFFLTTSRDVTDNKAAAKVKLNNTIKFTDGANTKVSTVDSKDGIHELHVDVTGLPVTYTASVVDDQGNPTNTQNVSKVGNTYQLEDGTKLVKSGDKYYKLDQIENGVPKAGEKGLTIDNSIRVINPEQPNSTAKITNVAPGEADTDAVNMSQLKQKAAAATTEVTGTGAAEVTKVTGANGQNIYNVHVDKLMTVKPVDANSTIARGGDGKYYNAGDIAGKTFVSDGQGGGSWYDTNDVDQATGKPKTEDDGITPKQPLADQPQAVDQNTLKNSVVNPNGNGSTVLDNVKSGIGGDAGNGIKNGSTIDGTTGNNTFIENLDKVGKLANEGGIDKTTVVNAGDLKNLADTPLFFSGDSADGEVAADGTDKNTFSRKLSQETKIVGGVDLGLQPGATAEARKKAIADKLTDGNIGVISDGTDTLTIKLAKELKDLASVKVSNGKDGKNLVTIGKEVDDKAPAGKDGENGFIGLDGKNGSEAVITINRGTKSITDEANVGEAPSQPVSSTNKSANMDRITYTTKGANNSTINHEVATLDDGFMLTTSTDVANSKAPANVKLNNTIKFTDGANTKVSTVTSKDGIHELHVDVTGLPVTYTATKTDAQGNVVGDPVNVSKVGDTYQDAAGNKLIKVGDKYYRPDQLVAPNVPNPEVKDAEKANGLTITDSISLVNNDGTTNPTTLKNVGSGLKDANGNATTLDKAVGSNAVNVDDLRTMGKAATTEVTGTGAAEVTKTTGADGQNIYNVHVDKLMEAKSTEPGKTIVRGSDNKYYYVDDALKQANDGKWYPADQVGADGKPADGAVGKDTTELTVVPADKLKNSLVNPNGNGPTVLDNVKSGIGGKVVDPEHENKNTFMENVDTIGKANGISENTVVNAGDLKNLVDTGFKLNTSGHSGDAQTVKIGETIKVVDGANTKVSDITSKDGVHEFHIDVTGLPMTYTVSQTGDAGTSESVSKVGDTYQLADGTKLVKVGDKFYKPSQLVDPNAEQPQVKPEEENKDWTVNDSISLVNKDGSNNAPTLKNVGSGLKDANGNSTTLDQAVGSNAVNVDDLRTLGKAATTEVTGTGAAEVTKVTGADGQNIYNVHVERFMQVAETDVEGNKVVKAADNHYYKEADIKDKTYIDGQWYNNTDIKDKTKIGDKWYSNTEITDGKANPGAKELTVQATTAPNKAVGLQNNLVNPNDNTPTRLSNLASALSGEVGNGANTEDNSAINGIDKNGKPTSESGSNTFVKNVLDLDATEKTVEQLKTSLGHDPSEDEVKAEKARAEKDKALLNSAVTVADLQKTLQSPLFFEGDSADGVANENGSDKNTFARKLSQKTKIVGGVDLGLKENATADERKKAIAEKLTDHNIGVISNGTDTLTIKLAKDLTDLHSVTTTDDKGNTTQINGKGLATTADNGKGNIKITTVTSDGITIVTTDKDGNNSVSLTNKGLDNGHHQIINVKSGLRDRQGNPVTLKNASGDILNNAVNVKDLRDVVQGLTDSGKGGGFGLTGNNGEVHKSLGETITLKGGIANKLENGIDMNKPEKATTDKNTYIDVKTSENGSEKIMVVEIAKDLTDLNSAEFTDQEGNTTKMKGDGIYIDKNGDGNADISLTSEGLNNGGNKITNVADGTEDTDAVNVSQLNKLKQEIKQNIGDEINELNAYAPVVYSDKDGNRVIRKGNKFVKKNDETVEILPQDIRLSLVNADGKTTNPSTLQNVAEGDQDTDAVNVKQLKEATEKPLTFNGDAGSSSAKLGETVAIKGGANSADLTDNNIGVIADSTTKTLNVKLSKKLKGLESAEFVDNNGNTTNITGDGVHISGGNGSNVSLTSQGLNNGGNRITNVAPGVEATDAVNVSQLNQVGAALHNRINNVAKGAYGGVASAGAMASLPQAYLPGKSMVAAGASHYRGESAVALGASRISDNGKIILKLNASHNTSGNTMVGAGVGYQF
ncbi:hypothetical protein IO44_05730 [Gallibacterium anatis str. Avicor]|uniref:YadA-like family protein n=1 Tax=Gallibacterium anatis TaxID=750 RepID=UPI00053160C8|nr:YadA-like family protein [Gallibacterium anatis]KGQ55514.1 hypothetical protein IO44_05730 [Gallibacterium anatis str. Avicor]